MAFYQKHRSKKFGDLIGQEHVAGTLIQSVKSGKLVHAYLLTGPRGIGKTSTARLLAKAVNCQKQTDGEPCNDCESCREIDQGRSLDVIEIDAASHTGVDDIRDLIDKARLAPTKSPKKVYIIDEVHMLSKSAFNALLKTLEEPPAHVVFIMATTESHKVPATIVSRVQKFDFKRASKEEIMINLERVSKLESIKIDRESLELIAVAASGGHRDALGLLEQIAASGQDLNIETTRNILGIAEDSAVIEFIGAIFNKNPEEGLKIARRLFEQGYDLAEFSRRVTDDLHKIMLVKVAGAEIVEEIAEKKRQFSDFASKISLEEILDIINIFIETNQLFKEVQYPIMPIEIAIVKAVHTGSENNQTVSHEKKVEVVDAKKSPAQIEPTEERPASEKIKPGFQTVPVIEMTKDIWHQIVDAVKKDNTTLAALLRDAKPEEVSSDALTLGVKFKFHKDRISDPKNISLLEKIVCDVTGSKHAISCIISDNKGKSQPSGEKIDLEKAVSEVFEIQ